MALETATPKQHAALRHYLICCGAVSGIIVACLLAFPWIDYKVVALLLLLCMSVLAMRFDVYPVLAAACLSAAAWNFLFIPPRFTFQIGDAEDVLLFGMYFAVAAVNAVLQRRIRAADQKLREQAEKARAAELYQSILNSLSHELRTPIATIIGCAETLEATQGVLADEQRDALLGELATAGRRLDRAVGNLLHASRLEAGALSLRRDWCDLGDLLGQLRERMAAEFPLHALALRLPPTLPLVMLDEGLLREALYNVLLNAAQYAPEGTTIEVHAQLSAADRLELVVRDHGPGFPPAELARVFDKFYRPPHSRPGGTGLGLSIVKGLVEAHGGEVAVANAAGGGARVALLIPVATNYINQLKHD